ncbi:MAG: hypothetical protein RLZ55_1723, partial [Actinomycetota bacterium]
VNLIYATSTVAPEVPQIAAPDKVVVYLNPIGLTPAEDLIKTRFVAQPPESFVGANGLSRDLEIHLTSVAKSFEFKAGAKQVSGEAAFIATDGTYEHYPFDRYTEAVVAFATAKGADGQEVAVPTELVVWGKFPGWRVFPATSRDALPADVLAADPELQGLPDTMAVAPVTVARSGSTMTIVVIVVGSMVVLTLLALVVARSVAIRRRKIEATMASWFAALLFAMVPLRTNLPGAPPIGVYLDFLVFLWILIGLMIALGIFITSWLRFTPRPESAAAAGALAAQPAQLPPAAGPSGPRTDIGESNST